MEALAKCVLFESARRRQARSELATTLEGDPSLYHWPLVPRPLQDNRH